MFGDTLLKFFTGPVKKIFIAMTLCGAFFMGVLCTLGMQKLAHPFRDGGPPGTLVVAEGGMPTHVMDNLGRRNFGWNRDDGKVAAVMATLPKGGKFKDVAPHLMLGVKDVKQDALLYKAWEKVCGQIPPAHNQEQVGCCVSEGYATGVELLSAVEIGMKGDAEEYKTVSHSAIYGLARARGHMLGNQDGLVGAYAADSVQKDGVVSCEEAGETNQSAGYAKSWGRTGVPSKIRDVAKQRTVKTVAQVNSADEVRAALTNGYPVPVCSDQGFSMTRDGSGRCRPQGTWNHCMCIVGYRADKDQFCIAQSWGDNTPSGPTDLGQPNYSFWVDSNVIQHMVSQGDTFALSNFDGWPAQKIDWFAMNRPMPRGIAEKHKRFTAFTELALAP